MTELATSVGVALVVTLLALWAAGPAARASYRNLAVQPLRRISVSKGLEAGR